LFLEAELNNTAFYSIVAITYAVVIGAVSLFPDEIKNGAFWILMASALLLIVYSVRRKKLIEQKTFLLKAVHFKLEELSNKNRSEETDTTNEAVISESIISKKNELKIFCNELSANQANKVDYVRKKLKEKYKNNTDIYLMFKAEAQENDGMQYYVFIVSLLSLLFTSFGFIHELIPNMGTIGNMLINMVLLIVIVCLLIWIMRRDIFDSVYKWRKYILVVIDDLIEESKRSTVTDEAYQIGTTNEENKANGQGE